MDRRTFSLCAFASVGIAATPVSARVIVAIDNVHLGYGPVIAHRLVPGMRLTTSMNGHHICVLAEDRLIGTLSKLHEVSGRDVLLTSASFGKDGRLTIRIRY